jgi:hypothetical protein
MTLESIWPFFDAIIKIGLGCVITLAALWLQNRRREPSAHKPTPNRRLALLEEISSAVGNVNHSFARYSSLVIESTRFGKAWPSARRLELEKVNAELVSEFRKLADAEAKLLMLGEKTMEKTLRLYGARIALFRKQVYVGRQDITEQEIADLKTSILSLREQFYDLLSRRYDRLLVA